MKLKKDALIQLANEAIELRYPDFDFDLSDYVVTAWRNSHTVVVKYRRMIQFIPLDRKLDNLHYDIEVDLTSQHISPFDIWGMNRFYIPTSEEQANIDFVTNVFGLPHPGFIACIEEDTSVYRIYLDNEQSFGRYVIDKITGIEYEGAIEGSYEPMPRDLDGLSSHPDPLLEIIE
ncbi:hypothetical protein N6H18_12400 [Reichenbachiella agarivorans]|uniref:Uncharacterized protein n=1 Tax=Reichenbachiella agarivorans TaxID=2979464 RepID=A0ABY6CKV6_9BACT|nr:hypothetical protein [Reichenbachiella agarivorans]UXP31149.1 hypothetical protein N6H18_12400 [Reichenbachiella agarivorans]